MGMTLAFILRHISALPPEQIFTTRELLHYGKRNQVDQVMYKLVKIGFLTRLVRGVFIKTEINQREISVLEVATIKAESFGRRIMKHRVDSAKELGLPQEENPDPSFEIDAHSSSFMFGPIKVLLKGTSPRKFVEKEEKHNHIARALWHFGESHRQLDIHIFSLWIRLNRVEKLNLKNYARWMPSWLSDKLSHGSCTNRPEPSRMALIPLSQSSDANQGLTESDSS